MKKILCLILAIGMMCGAASLIGCGSGGGGNNSGKNSSQNFNESGVPVPPTWDLG